MAGQPQWWLQVLGLVIFCKVLQQCASGRSAAWAGLLFATVWLSATFWWLFVAMHTYGGLDLVLAAIAVVLLAAALGLYYAIASLVYWQLKPRSPFAGAVLFGCVWTGAELARGTWLTGFGWGAIGYAHGDGPLRLAVPWIGVYGVGALAAGMSMGVAQLRGTRTAYLVALAVVAALALRAPLPSYTTPAGALSVTLLQGNIPQDQKFEPGSGVPAALAWYANQQNAASTDLVVAPETAIPLLPGQLPPGYWEAMLAQFQSGPTALLTGIPLGDSIQGYTNSVVGLSAHHPAAWRYDKHHLVPFGEFIPRFFRWFTELMNIPLGDFQRGALGQAPFLWKGQRLAPHICYEDLFGEELAVRFLDADTAPTIFVNVSNIGWFGNTSAIDQHLQISRMRALEFERPFVRATNTGATVIIDHQGQVSASLPRWTQGVLVGVVEGRTGTTPYAAWVSRLGLAPFWLVIVVVVVAVWRVRRTASR